MTRATTTTTKKKTRDLPNLTECHSCHVRVDLAKPKNQSNTLQILYSEWRIVLLCTKCLSRVESTALCSYCFNDTSSSEFDDCFRCRRCKRRVHKVCDSEHRHTAAAVDEDSVCADCWVPASLAKSRSVVVRTTNNNSCSRRNSNGKVEDLQLRRFRVSDDDDDDDDAEVESGDDVSDVEEDDPAEPRSFAGIRNENCGRGARVSDDDDDDAEIESDEDDDDSDMEEDPKPSVCGGACDSNGDDDDGALKEGQGSCSNGDVVVDVDDSPPLEDCNCTTTTRIRNTNMEPYYYFKYKRRRRDDDDQSVLTYKRRGGSSSIVVVDRCECDLPWLTYKRKSRGVDFDFPVLTYKRRNSVDPCYMFTYKRRSRCFDIDNSVVLTYKRRRPENDNVCFMVQLEGRC